MLLLCPHLLSVAPPTNFKSFYKSTSFLYAQQNDQKIQRKKSSSKKWKTELHEKKKSVEQWVVDAIKYFT